MRTSLYRLVPSEIIGIKLEETKMGDTVLTSDKSINRATAECGQLLKSENMCLWIGFVWLEVGASSGLVCTRLRISGVSYSSFDHLNRN